MQQDQFLEVVDRDIAERRFREAVRLDPRGVEAVLLADALGRVLAEDVTATVDVPAFDRANVDGFAVRAADTYGAFEKSPRRLLLNAEVVTTGIEPCAEVTAGTASSIATGAVVPRGADAVVMVEHTEIESDEVLLTRPVAPGGGMTHAGTDIARGETVLRAGTLLSSRETGVLAAVGCDRVLAHTRPRVAIFSTGNEIILPGAEPRPGSVFDSNATILADAVREVGGEPILLGIVRDDEAEVRAMLSRALAEADMVLLSGGTSKGAGDLNAKVVGETPGARILAHGVALKPGKPICLAAVGDQPVVILPGFPTSAIFTFHEFVAPLIRLQAGLNEREDAELLEATMPLRFNSEKGRTEYLLVGLSAGDGGLSAYPMGKGSGSVTTFSCADGFVTIPRNTEFLDEGATVLVRLLGRRSRPRDLAVIGSHCVGLDMLLGLLSARGLTSRFLAVGSNAGLVAARRGECDLAGVHLLDPVTGVYNRPFCGDDLELIAGYGRMQGVLFRTNDARFAAVADARDMARRALADSECILMNRNRGSGTRILIDELLAEVSGGGVETRGFAAEGRSHNSVAAAVAAGRADWGVAIETVARSYGLGFLPLTEERYDFVCPRTRLQRPPVQEFRHLLAAQSTQARLRELGFLFGPAEDVTEGAR